MAKLNLQQLPKDKNFLKCFEADPGHSLVYSDINSLEPHVLAHFSKDPGLMGIYSKTAKLNDVYLYIGANVSSWKTNILKYYDPNNPTPDGIAAAKKYAKEERSAAKPTFLGWMYGLSAGTMAQLTDIPVEECRIILKEIDDTFPGAVKFYEILKKQWEGNGGWIKQEWSEDPITGRKLPTFIDGRPGWIYNGRGRPMSIAPDKMKDLGSRFVQSTGHDVLMQMLVYINKLRKSQKVNMRPYNVDVHDATIWQVKNSDVDKAVDIFKQSYILLNNTLNWDVEIKGEVEVGQHLGDFVE